MIPINKPHLPDLNKYQKFIAGTFQRNQLTNDGPLLLELTARLEDYLGVDNLLLVANGTVALQVAIKALNISGNVLTSPFSFAATTSSCVWEGLRPYFVDINKDTFNIDACKLTESVTNVDGVLPVHVYGNPCDTDSIKCFAKKSDAKVIYDAAHAFGIKVSGQSILLAGDASTLSLHATKLFHTGEGGAIRFKSKETLEKAKKLINFGLNKQSGDTDYCGINAKMSELHAAMGLANLDEIDDVLEHRVSLYEHYTQELSGVVQLQTWDPDASLNGAYFPIVLADEHQLKALVLFLEKAGIGTRRYFYPSLNKTQAFQQFDNAAYPCPISESISSRVLCLPMYSALSHSGVKEVTRQIKYFLSSKHELK